MPSEKKKRSWRTRPDAFSEVWDEEIVPLLRRDAREKLQATVLLEWLDERHPGRFNATHLRTLQRRLRDWRALSGPEREVYFEQKHPPGREAQMDFTHCDSFEVTIGGEPFPHMVFEFILSHSGWALRADMLQRDVRGVEERHPRGARVGAWGSAGGGQERQPVCCDAQAEGQQGSGLQRALQGDTRSLRPEGYQDQLVQCARERSCGARDTAA